MNYRIPLGRVSRRLPRGRGHIRTWLVRHPGETELEFRDITGHWRHVNLLELQEARWFAGEHSVGIPREVLARIGRGEVVVDAGANIGVITGQLASAVGPRVV